eukprot:jgi/Tetstr1/443105/TSEL_031161.t1
MAFCANAVVFILAGRETSFTGALRLVPPVHWASIEIQSKLHHQAHLLGQMNFMRLSLRTQTPQFQHSTCGQRALAKP